MAKAVRPDWDRLYDAAAAQAGYVSTRQAGEAGYSPQLLAKHLGNGRILRVRRGVYRLKHFPPSEHEELVPAWLWSERAGVFSHETALALHGLARARADAIHLTLPVSWRRRRMRVPPSLVFHHADLPEHERRWVGAVPATSVVRTLLDCLEARRAPASVRRALADARE
jgi:predicted transcriptional regulator of viral defense system